MKLTMKTFLLLLVATLQCPPLFSSPELRFPSAELRILSAATDEANGLYETNYFTQILDHFTFRPESYRTFQQRYLINRTFWGGPKEKSPIFVYTGNEGIIDWFAQNTGFMFEIAPRFKALLVFIEHRFYGKSNPFGETANPNSSTLGYLSSTQALADYATLITGLKKNLTADDCPVVVFGGSYGGMLAAWFRLKYPHIAIGALASSAPILDFDNITSPYSFNNIIAKDFRGESENCFKVIKGSWQKIQDTAKQHGGLAILKSKFRVCKNSTIKAVDEVVGAIEGWLETAWVYTAMTDYPTPANFLTDLPAYPVKQMCKAIDDPSTGDDTFEKIYRAANIYYNYSGNVECNDPGSHSDPHGLDGWSWQACTEMVMPSDGCSEECMFSPHSDQGNSEYCKSQFDVTSRPDWVPIEFGGHDIKRVLKRFGSNIIFFNGLRDPWSGGGVLKSISKSIIAIVAKEGAHHVDLRYSTSEDPKWLQDVRIKEIKIIRDWISQYYFDLAHE